MSGRKKIIKTASKIHKRRIILRTLAVALSFVLVVTLGLFFALDDRFNAKYVEVFGNETIETSKILSVVDEKISGNYFWLFPRNNAFLYPRKDIKNDLLENYLRFEEVDVYVGDFPNIAVKVVERKKMFLWCDDAQCFYVDGTGLLFQEAPIFSGGVFLTFRGGEVDTENPLGSYVLPTNEFSLITKIFREPDLAGINFRSVEIKENDDFIFETSRGWEIRATRDIAENNFLNKLNLSLASEALLGKDELEYIDLRFGNKVFYKLKE